MGSSLCHRGVGIWSQETVIGTVAPGFSGSSHFMSCLLPCWILHGLSPVCSLKGGFFSPGPGEKEASEAHRTVAMASYRPPGSEWTCTSSMQEMVFIVLFLYVASLQARKMDLR